MLQCRHQSPSFLCQALVSVCLCVYVQVPASMLLCRHQSSSFFLCRVSLYAQELASMLLYRHQSSSFVLHQALADVCLCTCRCLPPCSGACSPTQRRPSSVRLWIWCCPCSSAPRLARTLLSAVEQAPLLSRRHSRKLGVFMCCSHVWLCVEVSAGSLPRQLRQTLSEVGNTAA